MRRSRVGWAAGVVAPWILAVGLVVSFTADAEQEPTLEAASAVMNAPPLATPADLVPEQQGALPWFSGSRSILQTASLVVGDAAELSGVDRERERQPRADLKPHHGPFPRSVDRDRGDPFIGLRPSFDSQLQAPGGLQAYRTSQLLSGEDYLAFDGFMRNAQAASAAEDNAAFEGKAASDGSSGKQTGAASSGRAESEPTLRSGSSDPQTLDGSSPPVGSAEALASATPAPADATPVEVVVIPGSGGDFTTALQQPAPETRPPPGRPDYASLIDPGKAATEERCLAEAVYFEARGEPAAGQAAVAQVVLNRVASGLYPSTVCGVVFQNRWRRNACQFSFACDGHPLRISEPEAWARAVRIAEAVSRGSTYIAAIGDATHYHANYVKPRWARYLKRTDRIGHHIFYELRPGQT